MIEIIGVLRPGAAVAELEALEARLGTRLPPSYRAFLLHSDGAAAQLGWGLTDSGPGLPAERPVLEGAPVQAGVRS